MYSRTVVLLLLLCILFKLIDTTLPPTNICTVGQFYCFYFCIYYLNLLIPHSPLLTFVQSDSCIAFTFVYTIQPYWYHTPPTNICTVGQLYCFYFCIYYSTYWYHTPPTNICTVGQLYCFYFCIYYSTLLIPHSPY